MIVFDASAVVSAALRVDSVPEQALLHADRTDLFALSAEVDAEIAEVLGRPRFARAVTAARRGRILVILRSDAVWFSSQPDPRPYKQWTWTAVARLTSGTSPCGAPEPVLNQLGGRR